MGRSSGGDADDDRGARRCCGGWAGGITVGVLGAAQAAAHGARGGYRGGRTTASRLGERAGAGAGGARQHGSITQLVSSPPSAQGGLRALESGRVRKVVDAAPGRKQQVSLCLLLPSNWVTVRRASCLPAGWSRRHCWLTKVVCAPTRPAFASIAGRRRRHARCRDEIATDRAAHMPMAPHPPPAPSGTPRSCVRAASSARHRRRCVPFSPLPAPPAPPPAWRRK